MMVPSLSGTIIGVLLALCAAQYYENQSGEGGARVIHDITVPYSAALPVFRSPDGLGDAWLRPLTSVKDGDPATTSLITLKSHHGTHLDAFRHFVPRGSAYDRRDAGVGDDIDSLSLQVLLGRALVVDVGDAPVIDEGVLEGLDIPAGVERVLFKTRSSRDRLMFRTEFDEKYVGLDESGARFVVERTSLKLVGIDYLSIAALEHLREAHRVLLGHAVIAVEGLNLTSVAPGAYDLACLPLRIPGGDGSPVRCVLTE